MTILNGRKTCYYCYKDPAVSSSGVTIKHNGVPVCQDHYPTIVNSKSTYNPTGQIDQQEELEPTTPRVGSLFGPFPF